jgi:hypothetical protein
MIFNKIRPYHIKSSSSKFDDSIYFEFDGENIAICKYMQTKRVEMANNAMPMQTKRVEMAGLLNIEKNGYGFEISIILRSYIKKESIIFTIFIMLYEYIHYEKKFENELSYIETSNDLYIKICKKLEFKNITTFGHTSSMVFKI